MTCSRTVEVGAYVLGALDPADRSDFERHLPGCTSCGDELVELAGLPGLLGRLTPAEAEESAAAPPAALLDRILARAGRQRRHRRRVLTAAAAAVILAGAGTGAGITATRDGGGPQTRLTAASGPVRAQATLQATAAGITVDLHLDGVPAGMRCRLVVVTSGGAQVDAGSWYANYDGRAGVHETAAVTRDQVSSLRVETLAGRALVTIPVTSG